MAKKASQKPVDQPPEQQPDWQKQIPVAMHHMALPLADLVPDPENARKHPEKNLQALMGSLREFGQVRAAVVQQEGMIIRVGNGMYEAAKRLGWTHLACLVQSMDDARAKALAIADNRISELAEWDKDVLRNLYEDIGVLDEELEGCFENMFDELKLLETDDEKDPEKKEVNFEAEEFAGEHKFAVVIDCENEEEQEQRLKQLLELEIPCRAISA